MIKLHLKSLTTDRQQLQIDKRDFSLELDGKLKFAKIAKGYAAIAYNDQLTFKIKRVGLKNESMLSIISGIVEDKKLKSPKFTRSPPKVGHIPLQLL